MLKRDDFVNFILEGPKEKKTKKAADDQGPSLPDGFDDYGFSPEETQEETEADFSFARQLMEASGFGNAEYLERSEVILGNDPAARYLPQKVYYWPKKDKRPYQTLLFELEQPGRQLLKAPLFKKLKSQEILEDAVSRLVQMSLRGFEKGGEKRTASVKSGKQNETLCIVSIHDDRLESDKPLHLICLGTKSKKLDSLENYHIREEARLWERQLAVDHLSRLYDRHFSKLDGEKWQDSFITGEERKLAQKLMDACVKKQPQKRSIEKCVVSLLEEIAKTFGLRKKKGGNRLMPFELPKDHDIGVDPEKREKQGGQNPFEGMILRDEKSRLLGYIIYCLDQKKDANKLRKYLERNNRFHNVLVIYPDGTEAVLELWQGMKRLEGKLTKQGAAFEGEGKIVNLLSRFFVVSKAKVRNPEELAQELAYRARYLRRLALKQLQEEKKMGLLRDLYNAFKEALIHDQTEDEFADSYAQTLTYGLLSARWISKDAFASKGERFTRKKALEHFPPSSSFLRDFFRVVLKAHSEFKLSWLLDDIADLLDRTDIGRVFETANGERSNFAKDPVIHFYEPFLAAYDATLKKKRGVYYTPQPIVSFIVRSVDKILRTEFGLEDGLADTTTWGEMIKSHNELKLPKNVESTEFFVQILDIATGTGTFIVEIIEVIYKTMMEKWVSDKQNPKKISQMWNNYVSDHLLTRLYGFELMMAPYAIAHMKIGLKLAQTGYHLDAKQRVQVFLANSLDQPHDTPNQQRMFTNVLANEAKSANKIKMGAPITVMVGNPPYAGESANSSIDINGNATFIGKIIRTYFEADGQPLGERTSKWLQDDYVKFIRFGQFQIEKVSVGVLGYITNHGYLDNPTFRGMRQSLMKSFPLIEIIDLHGNSKKKERCPDGSIDTNVFDIMVGTAVSVFTKTFKKRKQEIFHSDIWGPRTLKYKLLSSNSLFTLNMDGVHPDSPYYFFKPVSRKLKSEYQNAYKITDVFNIYGNGMTTARDHVVIDFDEASIIDRATFFRDSPLSDKKVCEELGIPLKKQWDYTAARKSIQRVDDIDSLIETVQYRPFDLRRIFYHDSLVWRTVKKVMLHLSGQYNMALTVGRAGQVIDPGEWSVLFCTKHITEFNMFRRGGNCVFPIYLYPDQILGSLAFSDGRKHQHNFDQEFIKQLCSSLQVEWENEGTGNIKDRHRNKITFSHREEYATLLSIFPGEPKINSVSEI